MAQIKKIKVGGVTYNIIPQLGAGLTTDNESVRISIGSGLAFVENKLTLNIDSTLNMNNLNGKLGITMGTAVVQGASSVDSGIGFNDNGLTINPDSFKAFLRYLGVSI